MCVCGLCVCVVFVHMCANLYLYPRIASTSRVNNAMFVKVQCTFLFSAAL